MNPSTASGRLVKDLLFSFIKNTPCHRCGEALTRNSFSIDHKMPWLDSSTPLETFFDLDNITFSHNSCNISAARKPHRKYETVKERKYAGDQRWWNKMTKEQQQARRQKNYLRYGC